MWRVNSKMVPWPFPYGMFPVLLLYYVANSRVCQWVYSNYIISLEVESVFWLVTEEVTDFRGVQRIQCPLTSVQMQAASANSSHRCREQTRTDSQQRSISYLQPQRTGLSQQLQWAWRTILPFNVQLRA